MARATITDVARHAGVSVTTVSHTLSGNRAVSSETAVKVLAAIAALNYRPSTVARSLRTQRTHTVALIVPDIANPFYPVVARGLQDAVSGQGYFSLIASTDGVRTGELGILEDVCSRSVDGIVIVPFALREDDLTSVIGERIPTVITTADVTQRYDRVFSDDITGAQVATEHLLSRGIHDIAYIGGPKGVGPGDRRLRGWANALHTVGIVPQEADTERTQYTVAGGRAAARRLLTRTRRPRAVLCANDLIAVGVLEVSHSLGLSVPNDLAVIGFDDIDAAALVTPSLTTVANAPYELGRRAGQLLIDRMVEGHTGPARAHLIPTELVVRSSA